MSDFRIYIMIEKTYINIQLLTSLLFLPDNLISPVNKLIDSMFM